MVSLSSHTWKPLTARGVLMALAHKPGGSDESCDTNRKLFPLSYRDSPKENRVTAKARWPVESRLNPNLEITPQYDWTTCGTETLAAARRRSAVNQLWRREDTLFSHKRFVAAGTGEKICSEAQCAVGCLHTFRPPVPSHRGHPMPTQTTFSL